MIGTTGFVDIVVDRERESEPEMCMYIWNNKRAVIVIAIVIVVI